MRIIAWIWFIPAACTLLSLHLDSDVLYLSAGGLFGSVLAGILVAILDLLFATLALLILVLVTASIIFRWKWLVCLDNLGHITLFIINIVRVNYLSKPALKFTNTQNKILATLDSNKLDSVERDATPQADDREILAKKHKQPKYTSNKNASLDMHVVDKTLLPSINILGKPKVLRTATSNLVKKQDIANLEQKLLEFGVQAQVISSYVGPVITLFELELAAGIKVSKVTAIAVDLSRALKVKSVRIVEVLEGKSTIGIEVPNSERETVAFNTLVNSATYRNNSSPLSLAVGVDISGNPVIKDLAKMPHLLVAGTTGSGKSVGVNTMLAGILLNAHYSQVKFIMVDPKMLELSVYDGIPHLLTPVITDMQETFAALSWCVGEMERRYKLLSQVGVRNIASFNEKVTSQEIFVEDQEDRLVALPYIVIVVDEFADMILMLGKPVELLIVRLAQKARAAGIHLILATQRPSVDIITGLIKANIPCRMSFQVSSKIDSRTILDRGGAEQLLGAGDMLYLQPGQQLPTRIHGSFISDNDVHKIVSEWKKIGKPQYIKEILQAQADANTGALVDTASADAEKDAFYDKAVEFVTKQQKVSTSSIQRQFQIGYNRAARIVDAMEVAGLVSSMDSKGKRKVLSVGEN